MKERNLYRILGDNMPFTEKRAFIYFLTECGAYNEFIKEMNAKRIMLSFNSLYMKNRYLLYSNIITTSFEWNKTNSGFGYWAVIHNLHQIILSIKCQYILSDYYNKLRCSISKTQVTHNDLQFLINGCSQLKTENTKLNCFIKELYAYLKEKDFIKNI